MLCVNASDVAAIIGKNKYKKPEEILIKYWKKNYELSYQQALQKANEQDEEEVVESVISTSGCEQILDKILNDKETNQKDLDQVQKKIEVFGQSKSMSKSAIELVKKEVVSKINKKRGIDNETTGLDTYEQKKKVKVTHRNEKKYYYQGEKFKIVGKIDGIENETTLIEHKHRINRLFNYLPTRERIQMMVYLKMTHLKKAKLVQHYKGDTKEFEIEFDLLFWLEIEAGLNLFAERYFELLSSIENQIEFLQKWSRLSKK